MGSNTCLVLHRKSANEEYVKAAVKAVKTKGIKLRVRIPWNKKDKPRVVKEALKAGATRVIAGGGDGTINAVVRALVGKGTKTPKASLGVMPLGTANDFAHGLGLPVDDLARCLEIACTAEARPMDVGMANGAAFINVTSGGFGSEITATTPVEVKKRLGGAAYTIMGFLKVFGMNPYPVRLLVPGEEPVEAQMVFIAVGNNRLAGGGFAVAPEAKTDDGLLDLAGVLHVPGMGLAELKAELDDPTAAGNRVFVYRQLPEFTIEAPDGVHYNLDGEPTVETRMHFRVLPGHLQVAY